MDATGYMGLLRELHTPDGFGPFGSGIRLIDAINARLVGLTMEGGLQLHISIPMALVPAGPEARQEMEAILLQEHLLEELEKDGHIVELSYSETEVERLPGIFTKVSYADFETEPHGLGRRLKDLRAELVAKATSVDTEQPISLTGKIIEFDDQAAEIRVAGRVCHLPPQGNEHDLARIVFFEVPVGTPIEASDVYEKTTGEMVGMTQTPAKALKSVQDTMYALNERLRADLNTPDSLLSWKNKTLSRNF